MQLNRADLQKLSKLRAKEAAALLKVGHAPGAYYLSGYAVECALKACIAKRTREFDFPDKHAVNKSWTHDLEDLLKAAELQADLERETGTNKSFEVNWKVVIDWSEEHRYRLTVSDKDAKDLLNACLDETNGVIPWIEKRW